MSRNRIEIEELEADVLCDGCGCDKPHRAGELNDVNETGCALEPGDPVPAGRCRETDSLCYPIGKRPKVVVVMEGGCISSILTNDSDVRVMTIDYCDDKSEGVAFPQDDGSTAQAYVGDGKPDVDTAATETCFAFLATQEGK